MGRGGDELGRRCLQAYSSMVPCLGDAAVPQTLAALAIPAVAQWLQGFVEDDPAASAASAMFRRVRSTVVGDEAHEARHVWAHPMSRFIVAGAGNQFNVARALAGVGFGHPAAREGQGVSVWRAAADHGMDGVLSILAAPPPQEQASGSDTEGSGHSHS